MPKSIKEVVKIFRTLGPDDSNTKSAVNASVRELEQRWPLFKTTPPQKMDQTPVLSEEEREHWLNSPKTRTENRKQMLSVVSATSTDRLSESLRKMARPKVKTGVNIGRSKTDDGVVIADLKAVSSIKLNLEDKNYTETKKTTQFKKVIEAEIDIDTKKNVDIKKLATDNKSVLEKRSSPNLAPKPQTPADEVKTLRSIFGRLSTGKIEQAPPSLAPAKSSVLKKLNKR
jgi:hypothetical protein